MNSVVLIGRLTKDPEVRVASNSDYKVARFNLAIDRGKDAKGESRGADFPSIVCFGKTADLIERYVKKGQQIGIQGRINTDSYEKDGQRVWKTEIIADRVEFCGSKSSSNKDGDSLKGDSGLSKNDNPFSEDIPGYHLANDDDIPF